MTDIMKYLNAWKTGDTSNLPEPDTEILKYLAAIIGVYNGDLPEPTSDVTVMLKEIYEQGTGGGDLPALVNPALVEDILSGKEAIDGSGKKITGTMPDNGTVAQKLTVSAPEYTILAGKHGGEGKVFIEIEEKTATPSTSEQEVTPTDGKVLSKVTVEAVQTEEKSVTPTSAAQEVTPSAGKFLSKVTVGAAAGGDTLVIRDARNLFGGSQRVDYYEDYFEHIPADALMSSMFKNASMSRTRAIDFSTLDTSKNKDFTSFFENFSTVSRLVLDTLCVDAATSFGRMFASVSDGDFKNPDFSSWKVGNVINMQYMFVDVRNLTSPNFTGWDTSKVTDMSYMFGATKSVNRNDYCLELDISSFDTSAVTNMASMFSNLSKVKRIIVGEGFTTVAAQNMSKMFYGCNELEAIPHIDFSAATIIQDMFSGCKKLKGTIDMSGNESSNIGSLFNYCVCLEGILNMESSVPSNGLLNFSNGWVPAGSANDPAALKRLTFGYDVENGGVMGIANMNIKYCSFVRAGMVELFNSLPNITGSTAGSYMKTVTITGNPCVMDTINLTAQTSFYQYIRYEDLCQYAVRRYRGFDYQNAPIKYYVQGQTANDAITTTFSTITAEMFEGGKVSVMFLADTITVPEEKKLSAADREIATSKGWQLAE